MELTLFLLKGWLEDIPLPEDIIKLIEELIKLIKLGGSPEDIIKLIELIKLLGLLSNITELIEFLKLFIEGLVLLNLLWIILCSLGVLLGFITFIIQRINRNRINLVFVYITTGSYMEDGSPIYRVGLVDTCDPNMLLLRSILRNIPDHGFRITPLTNNQGGYLIAIETNLEIAGELNSRFSGAPLWLDALDLEISWRAWPTILGVAVLHNISLSTGLDGNRVPITFFYVNPGRDNFWVVIKSNYGALGPYYRQE